jgi:hypothetical protein
VYILWLQDLLHRWSDLGRVGFELFNRF